MVGERRSGLAGLHPRRPFKAAEAAAGLHRFPLACATLAWFTQRLAHLRLSAGGAGFPLIPPLLGARGARYSTQPALLEDQSAFTWYTRVGRVRAAFGAGGGGA